MAGPECSRSQGEHGDVINKGKLVGEHFSIETVEGKPQSKRQLVILQKTEITSTNTNLKVEQGMTKRKEMKKSHCTQLKENNYTPAFFLISSSILR